MQRLIYLLYEYKASVVFVLLELTSISLVATYRTEEVDQGPGNHRIMGHIHTLISEIQAYTKLRTTNVQLHEKNRQLRQQLLQIAKTAHPTLTHPATQQYTLVPAQVINSSIIHTKNYLTLNKGAQHGLKPGMGVISAQGIVGKIKAVSPSFATVVTLLHTDVRIAAKLAQTGVAGTVQWNGQDPFRAQLLYVPRHVTIAPEEAVVTSGYNATFFEDIPIGHVKRTVLRPEAPFYDIELRLSTDFSTLQHVYVVQNALKQERSTLEQHTQRLYE